MLRIAWTQQQTGSLNDAVPEGCAARFSAGTHLFSDYIYNLSDNVSNSTYRFYAANTIVYC